MGQEKKQSDDGGDYIANLKKLIYYATGVALGVDPDQNMIDQAKNNDELVRQMKLVVPHTGVNAGMVGRYLLDPDKPKALKTEAKPPTHLTIALYLWTRVKGRWGPTKEDALASLYDWLYYGPDADPATLPPDRHSQRPLLEKIEVKVSKSVEEIEGMLPTLTDLEVATLQERLAENLRLRIENRLSEEATPESEPEPEPPCDEDNPVCHYLSMVLHLENPLTIEAIQLVADKVGFTVARSRALLCGDEPTPEEHEQIAAATGMSMPRYEVLMQRLKSDP